MVCGGVCGQWLPFSRRNRCDGYGGGWCVVRPVADGCHVHVKTGVVRLVGNGCYFHAETYEYDGGWCVVRPMGNDGLCVM